MNNSEKLPQKSDEQTQVSKLTLALGVAMERTGTAPFQTTQMAQDIAEEFKNVDEARIIKALRDGGLGRYGKTYKFCTQEICIWIREEIKPDSEILRAPKMNE